MQEKDRTSEIAALNQKIMESLPDKLYKFYKVDERLVRNLMNKELWFSKSTNFNDPYDCYGQLITYEFSNKAKADHNIKRVVNAASNKSRNERRIEINKLKKKPQEFIAAYNSTKQNLIESQGICCFTNNPLSTLMWSHYANCHKGLALIFEHISLKYKFDIHRVKYTDDFKPINYFEEPEWALTHLFTTKSIEWKYEDEYRAIKDGSGPTAFPKSSLKGVIFGCKISIQDKQLIKDAIKDAGYTTLQFFQARMLHNSFKLSIESD